MKKWIGIAALAENRAIGVSNRLPWHLPEDFKWFKGRTMGGLLLMGRKTYESIGRPLPGRQTVVLSRAGAEYPAYPAVRVLRALEEYDWEAEEREVFVCGGQQMYELLLPQCEELLLTHVHRTVEGADAFFPEYEGHFTEAETLLEAPEFSVKRWVRRT